MESVEEMRNYYLAYKNTIADFFDLGVNLLYCKDELELIQKEMKKKEVKELLLTLTDTKRDSFLQQELIRLESKEGELQKAKYLSDESVDWLLHYFLIYTMTQFYSKMVTFIISCEESQKYSNFLDTISDFRKEIAGHFAEFKNKELISTIGSRKGLNDSQLGIISIAEGLVLHTENQYLKINNQILEIVNAVGWECANPKMEVTTQRTNAKSSQPDIMKWTWQREVLLTRKSLTQDGVFNELPFREHAIELKVNQRFFRNTSISLQQTVMTDMALEFFSVGLHSAMEDVICSFEEWSVKDFEEAWMRDWGYDFRTNKAIERESVTRLETMRSKVLAYDPLLLIVAERELGIAKREKNLTHYDRLIEFVEVQLMLTKICHLPTHARKWKEILRKLGKSELQDIELLKTPNIVEVHDINRSFIGPPYGKRWLLARIYRWFVENRMKGKSLKHLLMLDANLFEGQIRGHTFIDKKNNVESSWGEKIIVELKRFHHDDIGDIKDSFLYIYTGQSLISNATITNNLLDLKKKQDKAYLYRMGMNHKPINRGLKDTELPCLTVERMSNMRNLNDVYQELMDTHSYDEKLDSFVQQIIRRFWKESEYLNGQFPSIHLKNLILNENEISDVHNVILVQAVKHEMERYYMVHGDEWGANFMIDGERVVPIDFEDVVYGETSETKFSTGGGTLAQRFIEDEIENGSFESKSYAPVNAISSLGRLMASLIQYRCRYNRKDIVGIPGQKLLEKINREVKKNINGMTKEKQKCLLDQLNLSIIDWLAHWVNKSEEKMPREDFDKVRDYILKNYLHHLSEEVSANVVPISVSKSNSPRVTIWEEMQFDIIDSEKYDIMSSEIYKIHKNRMFGSLIRRMREAPERSLQNPDDYGIYDAENGAELWVAKDSMAECPDCNYKWIRTRPGHATSCPSCTASGFRPCVICSARNNINDKICFACGFEG